MKMRLVSFAILSLLLFYLSSAIETQDYSEFESGYGGMVGLDPWMFAEETGSPLPESAAITNIEGNAPRNIFNMVVDTQRREKFSLYKDQINANFNAGDVIAFMFRMQGAYRGEVLRVYLEKQDEKKTTQMLCAYQFKDDNPNKFSLAFRCGVDEKHNLIGQYRVKALLYNTKGKVVLKREWGRSDPKYVIYINTGPVQTVPFKIGEYGGSSYRITIERGIEPYQEACPEEVEEELKAPVALPPVTFTEIVPGAVAQLPVPAVHFEWLTEQDKNCFRSMDRDETAPTPTLEPKGQQTDLSKLLTPISMHDTAASIKAVKTTSVRLEILDSAGTPLCDTVMQKPEGLKPASDSSCIEAPEDTLCITPGGLGIALKYCGSTIYNTFVQMMPILDTLPLVNATPTPAIVGTPTPAVRPTAVPTKRPTIDTTAAAAPNSAPQIAGNEVFQDSIELVFDSVRSSQNLKLARSRTGEYLFSFDYLVSQQLPDSYTRNEKCFTAQTKAGTLTINYNPLCQSCGHIADLSVFVASTGKKTIVPVNVACKADVLLVTDGDRLVAEGDIEREMLNSDWYAALYKSVKPPMIGGQMTFSKERSFEEYHAEVANYMKRAAALGKTARYVELQSIAVLTSLESFSQAPNQWPSEGFFVDSYVSKVKSLRKLFGEPNYLILLGQQRVIPSKTYGQDDGAFKAIISSDQPYGTALDTPDMDGFPVISVSRIPGYEILQLTELLRAINEAPTSITSKAYILYPEKAKLAGAKEGRDRIVAFYYGSAACGKASNCVISPPTCTEKTVAACDLEKTIEFIGNPFLITLGHGMFSSVLAEGKSDDYYDILGSGDLIKAYADDRKGGFALLEGCSGANTLGERIYPVGTRMTFKGTLPDLPEGLQIAAKDYAFDNDVNKPETLKPGDSVPYLYNYDFVLTKGTSYSYSNGVLTFRGEFSEDLAQRILPISTALLLYEGKTSIGYTGLSRYAFTFPNDKSSLGKPFLVGDEYLKIIKRVDGSQGRKASRKIGLVGDPLLTLTVNK